MVKEFLSQKGVEYRERDISLDRSAAQEVVKRTGQMGIPVTIINSQAIIGYDRVRLEQALRNQQKPSFGASVADASKITAKKGSVAHRTGLAPGDIITELNVQRITNANDLETALSKLSRGSRFSIVFIRGDRQLSAEGTI
jgi:S1-C subfamily serine protease